LKYSAAAFAWIFSIIYMSAIAFPTTIVLDGACYPYQLFVDYVARMIQFLADFFVFYVFVILICIFGYWRILIVIRRQARVMAAHSTAGSSTGQAQSNQIETNVIRTFIYATSFNPVKKVLLDKLSCKKISEQASENVANRQT